MTRPAILDLDLVVVPQAMTPEMIAAAWAAWHSRHGGKIGPDAAFCEAVPAAIFASPYPTAWDDVRKYVDGLDQENAELKGALRADAERLQIAGDRVDLATGCDTADAMADEIEHLRLSLSEAIAQRDAAFEMSKCECGTDEACRNLAKMQSDYELLARHIAPDVDVEYIWSHLPEQIIDAGLQLQASALSKARATGRREGIEEAAKWHDAECHRLHEQIKENLRYMSTHGLRGSAANDSCREEIITHKLSAAAIRAAMEKEE